MPFNSHVEFRQFLDGASMALTGKRASTHRVPRFKLRNESSEIAWWQSTGRTDGQSEFSLARNRAYLLAYFEAATPFPAVGLRLADGAYICPDRSVIERSLRDGHVMFDPDNRVFCITAEGLRFRDCQS